MSVEIKELLLFLIFFFIAALIYAVMDARRERKAFQKWLREGRWKFEKFTR